MQLLNARLQSSILLGQGGAFESYEQECDTVINAS